MKKILVIALLLGVVGGLTACCNTGCNPCQQPNPCQQECNPCQNPCQQPNPCAQPCSPCGAPAPAPMPAPAPAPAAQ